MSGPWAEVAAHRAGRSGRRGGQAARVVAAMVMVCLAAGCVRRTVTVNTDPQGATVILNDEEIGTSPVSVDFIWYGDYDVTVRKEGYETLHTHERLTAPWYQVPPIDLIAEALIPVTLHDRHEMSFALEPASPIARQELIEQAEEFRERALFQED